MIKKFLREYLGVENVVTEKVIKPKEAKAKNKEMVLTEEEQSEIMQSVLAGVDLSDKHESTVQLFKQAMETYANGSNLALADNLDRELQTTESIESFEEELHDSSGRSTQINKPLRAVGTTSEIAIDKYMINPDYREEVIEWIEKLMFTDEHLGGAAKKIAKMLSTEFTIDLKYENNTVLKDKMIRILEGVNFGDMNIEDDDVQYNESNNAALNNMALQMIITGAIGRVIVTHKGEVVGTTPIDLKHAKPYITEEGNIKWLQKYNSKNSTFEYLAGFLHDNNNIITDTKYIVNPHRGVNHNGMLTSNNIMQVGNSKYLKLNQKRFIYQPALTYQDNPLGIPPFLTAIASGKLERSMMGGVASYAERFNAVSFLTVLVRPIVAKNGEGRNAYAKRVTTLLTKVTDKIEQGFRHGFFIGFKGVHELEINSTQADAKGFDTLYKWAVINKSSGLGIPPLLLGVETQVSESLARILIQTMVAELKDYQDAMADAMVKFYTLYLKLNHPDYALEMRKNNTVLKISFTKSTIQDSLRYEQTLALTVNRLMNLVKQGVISNEQMAKELGYSKSYLPEPPTEKVKEPVDNTKRAKARKDDPKPEQKPSRSKQNSFRLGRYYPRLASMINEDYDMWDSDHTHEVHWSTEGFVDSPSDNLRKDLFDLVNQIQVEVGVENKSFALKLEGLIGEYLKDYKGKSMKYEDFITKFMEFIQKSFFQNFDYEKVSSSMVKTFKNTNFNTVLKSTGAAKEFLNKDFHKYFKNVSSHYLGKFISNAPTVTAINDYLIDKVVTNEIIVFDDKVIQDIRNMAGVVLPAQDYQLRRVVATTVSKYQNAASVLAMESVGITEVEVMSLMAANTCSYCKTLNGRVFSVPTISNRYKQVIGANVLEDVNIYTPFVTNLYKSAKDMPLDSALLALSGVVIPFHSHCQCVYVIAD